MVGDSEAAPQRDPGDAVSTTGAEGEEQADELVLTKRGHVGMIALVERGESGLSGGICIPKCQEFGGGHDLVRCCLQLTQEVPVIGDQVAGFHPLSKRANEGISFLW